MSDQSIHYSSQTDEWETPNSLFSKLNDEFHFDIDLCANEKNSKCGAWCEDAKKHEKELSDLIMENRSYFMNPPYSRGLQRECMDAAKKIANKGNTVVCLIPARTDTKLWHDLVWSENTNSIRNGVELRLIKGRLKFELNGKPVLDKKGRPQSAPFPSAVVVFI